MVDTVVPSLAGLLLIAVVALEKTDGLTVADANHDLAFLTVFT